MPKVSYQTKKWLKVFNLFSLLIPGLLLVFFLFQWNTFPQKVPVHFNFQGEVDRWGSPVIFPVLCAVNFFLCFGLVWLQKIPHKHNYPIKITPENAALVYQRSNEMLGMVALFISIGFSVLNFMTYRVAIGKTGSPFVTMLVFIFGLLAVILFGYLRIKRNA